MKYLFGLTLLAFLSTTVSAQGWREIVPLHSDCGSAKQILGINDCKDGTYHLLDATVRISFSDGTCQSGWKVASGTVLSLLVSPRTPQRFTGASIDATKYVKSVDSTVRNVVYYDSKEEGVSIAVLIDGTIA